MSNKLAFASGVAVVLVTLGLGYVVVHAQESVRVLNMPEAISVVCAPCSGRPFGLKDDEPGMVVLEGRQLYFYSLNPNLAKTEGIPPQSPRTAAQGLGAFYNGTFSWPKR